MKTCSRCKVVKTINEFGMSNGRPTSACKVCNSDSQKAYRLRNLDRVKTEQSVRIKQWKAEHPERAKAEKTVANALRDERLVRWPACAVPECAETKVEGHHADYSRPLDVVWLCKLHHVSIHKRVGKAPHHD